MKEYLWEKLKEDKRPIVLYGMTDTAEKVINELDKIGRKISAVFASNDFVRNKTFYGHLVKTLKEVENEYDDFIILLCFGSHKEEVINLINDISNKHELYAPDFPVIGDGIFTYDYYQNNKEKYDFVRSLLADDQSIKVFESVINYRISGKLDYLYQVETSDTDNWNLALPKNVLLDLGAYTGDTIDLFINLNPNYQKIIAVEPSSRNFRKLTDYVNSNEKIDIFNLGISDKIETNSFPKGSGRGTRATKFEEVNFSTIDTLLSNKENLDDLLIKLDIEGWEEKAILGGKETIKKYTPNMYIAAYHRLDDLVNIPLKVLEINQNYKIYLRHSRCIPSWENNYIFIKK